MTRAVNSNPDNHDQLLIELPLSVLAPRRTAQRFGRHSADIEIRPPALPAEERKVEDILLQEDRQHSSHLTVLICYIVLSVVCQMLLLFPALTTFRMPLRMLPFLSSVALIAYLPRKKPPNHWLHPSLPAAIAVIVIVMFSLLNAQTESMLAGVATVVFYIAVLAPIVWMGRLQINERGFVKVVLLLWCLNAVSSAVGVLQVAYPGQFTPATSQIIQQQQEVNGSNLTINLANGKQMERPYGLTDQPGGVAGPGLVSFVFGLGLLSTTRRPFMIVVYALGMAAGLFVIYLCQVRVALVTVLVSMVGYLFLLLWRGQFKLLTRVLTCLCIIITFSTIAALIIGGAETANRILSLVADDPTTVYYSNRGFFLDTTFRYLLPQYPVGAGLGRYGMMAMYFAADKGLGAHSLWAEIQWTAWVYDGGFPMLIAYPLAILLALWITLKISFDQRIGVLNIWATILAAYNISAIAITFSYCLFNSQSGLEFWMLNAAIYTVYQVQKRQLIAETPAGFESITGVWQPGVSKPVHVNPIEGFAPVSAAPDSFDTKREPLRGRSLKAVRALIDAPDSGASP